MNDFLEIIKAARQFIESERLFGVKEFLTQGSNNAPEKKIGSLEKLQEQVVNCERCKLAKTRTNVVFGEGSTKSGLMIIGEAPGEEEDVQGRPFVGRAGQLLTKIIEAIDLKREAVYIANALKCRPPFNRSPAPDELDACRHYLIAQINFIKPKVILSVGKFAAQILLNTDEPISKIRGRFAKFMNIPLMPTFHPSYLLRNPSAKRLVWHDVKLVKRLLGDL